MSDDLHPNVALVQGMDWEERERFWERQFPSRTCGRCLEFKSWLQWADGEPSSLRSFLWTLLDEHTETNAE